MFNHTTLEQDIERLGKEISEKRSSPEHKDLSERELVKKAIEPLVKETPASAPSQTTQPSQSDDSVLPGYLKDSPAEVKLEVEQLVDSVFHQGIGKAVKRAREAGYFILDAFHDALTDKLHDELKKRKLI